MEKRKTETFFAVCSLFAYSVIVYPMIVSYAQEHFPLVYV